MSDFDMTLLLLSVRLLPFVFALQITVSIRDWRIQSRLRKLIDEIESANKGEK